MRASRQPQTIGDAVLEPEQFLIVHIGKTSSSKVYGEDSVRTKDSELWFFQIADRSGLDYKPLRLFDSNGNAQGPIGSESASDYNQLYDSQGNDILRNNEESFRVYHYSLGVKQDNIRIYPRIPESQNGGAFTYLTANEPDPTEPSPYGSIESSETSYSDPSIELESLVWETGTLSAHQYGFYNDKSVKVDPLISIEGAAYELRPVVEKEAMLELLAEVGRPVEKQDNRVHMVSYSRNNLRSFSYDVPDEWESVQNTLTIQKANLPEDIEETVNGKDSKPAKPAGANGGDS